MMLTWKLWNALKNPLADHPLFRRAALQRRFNVTRATLIAVSIAAVSACMAIIANPGLILLLFLLPVIYIAFHGVFYGLLWAVRVSQAIAREQQQRTYDVLALTPYGSFGAHWMICTGCIHRGRELEQLQVFSAEEFFIALIVAVALSVERSQFYASASAVLPLMFFYAAALLLIFYLNHVQSVILGCLIGMLIPTRIHTSLDAPVYAFGTYLLIQISTYVLTLLVLTAILPQIGNNGSLIHEILIALGGLVIFYAVREAIIRALWWLLARALNAAPAEFEKFNKIRF